MFALIPQETAPDMEEILREELEEAKNQLAIARENFDLVEEKYFSIANDSLTLAEKRVSVVLEKLRIYNS